MQHLRYNNASNVLRFALPAEWNIEDLSALTLTIKNLAGTELLAASAVTMYTATELDGDVSRYDKEITLDSGATDLDEGDEILIVGSAGKEHAIVEGYDSTTKIATLERILDNPYDDGDAVYGLFGSITVDTTVVATFPVGTLLTLVWTPTGTGHTTRQPAQISVNIVDVLNLRKRFSIVYPRAYNAFIQPVDRFADMVEEAEQGVRTDMELAEMNYDRLWDQDIAAQLVMAKLAFLWTFNGDVEIDDERKFLEDQYDKKLTAAKKLPMWTDSDDDDTEDDGEITDHEHIFEKGW